MSAPTMKLYEISTARDILDSWLDESEGELTPALEELLDSIDAQFDAKAESVALYIRERAAQAKAVKEERDRLDAIVKREERAAESLKGYLKLQMERLGKTKVNGLLATIAIQKSPPAVTTALTDEQLRELWDDEDTLSPITQFIRQIPARYTIDRDSVLAAHKAGDALPPEIQVTQSTHLRVR